MTSTTDTTDYSGPGRKGPVTTVFNAASHGVHEVEIKKLVIGNDRSVFKDIERFFNDRDMIRLAAPVKALQTRQLDTVGRDLLKKGITLRVRGECTGDDLNKVESADICLKEDKSTTASGALKRNEFEARIRSFETATLLPLLKKYAKDEYPELHKTLNGMPVRKLMEHFRIDCLRRRMLVELPEDVTGLPGKRFVGELILDDVAYVMDVDGRHEPLVIARDLEVECEAMFKVCAYDANPEAAKAFVSSPDLTQSEVDHCMKLVGQLLDQASAGRLVANEDSKAERGFTALDKALVTLAPYLKEAAQPAAHGDKRIRNVFTVAAAGQDNSADPGRRLHKHLPESMRHVLQERPIAQRRRLG